VKNLSALVVNAIMLVIIKVIFSCTGSGTGIGVGIGRDVETVLHVCLFFAAGQARTNERADSAACGEPPECMFTLGYPHPCESMLCMWVSYNRNENKRCVLYMVQNLRAH